MKKRLAEEYDAPLNEISKFYTMNQHIEGMKKISRTLLTNWEKLPDNRKNNLLENIREMSNFIL